MLSDVASMIFLILLILLPNEAEGLVKHTAHIPDVVDALSFVHLKKIVLTKYRFLIEGKFFDRMIEAGGLVKHIDNVAEF